MASGDISYDWTQSEEQILVDMIRADNPTNLTLSMVSFGQPYPLTPTQERTHNTAVEVSATPTAPFTGSQIHRYHRVDIEDFVFDPVSVLSFYLDYVKDNDTLVGLLSERLGINLTIDKIVFDFPTAEGNYVLKIADHSLCYYGELELRFYNDILELSDVVINNNLVGFEY